MSFDPASIRSRFEDVRERTLSLVAPLEWPVLRRQHVPILSPMVWDLGHIGQFEEMWLLGELTGAEPLTRGYADMFDPAKNPRPTREGLPLPERPILFDYLGRVRERVLGGQNGGPNGGPNDGLNGAGEGSAGNGAAVNSPRRERLLAGGFVHELVAQHEEQHQETILQALQICADPPYLPAQRRPTPPGREVSPTGAVEGMVRVPAGPFVMGTDRPGFAYDNERRAHEVELCDFWIDALPVSNATYLEFIDAGGYRERRWWSEKGWAWREETAAEAPLYWRRDGGRWLRRRFGAEAEPPAREPVMHVTYWEAEAYARWAGKRLPTEAEWEKAALWDPEAGRQRLHPWGDEPATPERANVDQLAFGPAELGAYPAGASAYGAEQMAGDCWEWTASDFTAYPGFEAFPYREYSADFFGPDYKVLRGGSWATRPAVARGTFRNWDYPIRRQIFTGIRCARDD